MVTCAWREKVILFAKSKADVERESCRVIVRQGGRKSEEVGGTVSGSRRRVQNTVRKSAERRRQREQLEGKAETEKLR